MLNQARLFNELRGGELVRLVRSRTRLTIAALTRRSSIQFCCTKRTYGLGTAACSRATCARLERYAWNRRIYSTLRKGALMNKRQLKKAITKSEQWKGYDSKAAVDVPKGKRPRKKPPMLTHREKLFMASLPNVN